MAHPIIFTFGFIFVMLELTVPLLCAIAWKGRPRNDL